MLDTETKRRIDTARDILAGKIHDPKSQVEQITIALIYKFMNDMDAQVEELGGDRTFFNGEFEDYSWKNLTKKSLNTRNTLNPCGWSKTSTMDVSQFFTIEAANNKSSGMNNLTEIYDNINRCKRCKKI